jgi:hypothetical protein
VRAADNILNHTTKAIEVEDIEAVSASWYGVPRKNRRNNRRGMDPSHNFARSRFRLSTSFRLFTLLFTSFEVVELRKSIVDRVDRQQDTVTTTAHSARPTGCLQNLR